MPRIWDFLLILKLIALVMTGCASSKSSTIDTDSNLSADDTDSSNNAQNTDTSSSSDTVDSAETDPESLATWGWISAIEWNDTCDQWYMKTDWTGGVRAYFAERASYPRSLPHHLGFIPMVASEGSCRLYDAGILSRCEMAMDCFWCIDIAFECDEGIRWCDQDQQCHADEVKETGVCRDLPPHWNLGTITLEGFKDEITLQPDVYDRYYAEGVMRPNDLFDDGDVLIARTSGGSLPALTFSTKGVAPLEVMDGEIDLRQDHSVVVEWTPADDDSRIQVALTSGSHDPNPLTASILCDVPDSDGRVEISANLVNGFLKESCMEAMMKCSRITRYTRDVKIVGGKEIEFFVGSARNLRHNMFMGF